MKCCAICGTPFPPDAPGSKKYCRECAIEHNRELCRIKQQKRAAQRAKEQIMVAFQETTRAKDREYCNRCVYHTANTESYLCNYILITGTRRGCPAGVGCTKRTVNAANG